MFCASGLDKDKTKQNQAQVYEHVTVNEGNCFDEATGVFTAPVTGAYAFSASVESNSVDVEVCSHIMTDDNCHAVMEGDFREKSFCTLVPLKRNQSVWMKAVSPVDKYRTILWFNSLYCFLVQAEP